MKLASLSLATAFASNVLPVPGIPEEGLSKKKSVELFENGCLDSLEAGTHAALAEIHRRLFDAIYDCAGRMRRVGSAKGNSLRAVDVS